MSGGNLGLTSGGRLVVRTPYNPSLLGVLRGLPGAKWDGEQKVWTVSGSDEALPTLIETARTHGWVIEPSILDRARELAQVQEAGAEGADERAALPGLYPFQREGVRWLARRSRALLSDDMGLGKTVQVLAALPTNAPVLVICPASIKGVWARETARWRPKYRIATLSGRGSHRWPEPGEVLITNYDILPKPPEKDRSGKVIAENDAALLKNAPKDLILVVDEVHACKGSKTRRTKAVKYIKNMAARIYGLTGTPLINRPPELWQVLETLGLAEEAFTHFGRFYWMMGGVKNRYGTDWEQPKPEVAGCLKRVMLRRRREEVLPDLPVKTFREVRVTKLKAGLRKRLDEVLKEWKERAGIIGPEMPNELPPFQKMSAVRAELAAAKIPTLLELVENYEAQEEPLVVFSAHRAPIDALSTREGWARITGDESPEERTQVVAAFQAGDLRGVALTIGAGREGITLTRGAHMIFVDRAWQPAWNSQAEDRICRIGQTRGCFYTILVADHPLDERLEELLQEKQGITDASIEKAAVRTAPRTLAEVLDGSDEASKTAGERARAERERALAAGEIQSCPKCGTEIELRTAGPKSKNQGRRYFACQPCDWFIWEGEKEQELFVIERLLSGGYALESQEGGIAFYLIQCPTKDKWAGWTFVRLQVGPESSRLGSVDPDGRVRGASNVRSILERIITDPKEAMARYGRELGFCGMCGLALTNDESRALGVGPICAGKFQELAL